MQNTWKHCNFILMLSRCTCSNTGPLQCVCVDEYVVADLKAVHVHTNQKVFALHQ